MQYLLVQHLHSAAVEMHVEQVHTMHEVLGYVAVIDLLRVALCFTGVVYAEHVCGVPRSDDRLRGICVLPRARDEEQDV
jgi:hypothetical protein